MQILKEEIRQAIFNAAVEAFYEKNFQKTTMQDIADKAEIAPSLIYTYYKNKQTLFNTIIEPIVLQLHEKLAETGKVEHDIYEWYIENEKPFFLEIMDHRLEFLILMDKSQGTSHQDIKNSVIQIIEEHIKTGLRKTSNKDYDELFAHILASNFIESFLEILRHYKNKDWAVEMLDLMMKHFYYGSSSL